MNPNIECLPKEEGAILTVARWLCDEWGAVTNKLSPQAFAQGLKERTGCDTMPFTLVARCGDELVGTASLYIHVMESHQHLSP